MLFADLAQAYRALLGGYPPTLPELRIQYADFAAWQRRQAAEAGFDRHLDYWKKQLANPTTLQLPIDRPRPPVQSFDGAWQSLKIPLRLVASLRSLAESNNVTLYMLLMAAFKTLLLRYSRQTNITVGTAVTQRDRPELEPLIGFFVNAIPLRTSLDGNPTFCELLGRIRETALDGYDHGGVPFEVLVETLQPDRDPSQNPLFQVMFELPTDPRPVLKLDELQPAPILGPLELNSGTTKSDMSLYMWEESHAMVAAIEFRTELFDAATIQRMLANFEVLLESCAADPNRRLSDLALLTHRERRLILTEWNATQAPLPLDQCTHQLVAKQAAETPNALAIACAGSSITYSEWNQRANQLAHYLRSRGVGPDVLVAVLMSRTPEMVTALLAVMKAGGAYVPLDPANPRERQALMLEDAQVPVLLTDATARDQVPEIDAEIVCLDSTWQAFADQPTDNPVSGVATDDLAYVIFTSGSTGRPKGVPIPHRALLNLVFWHRTTYSVTAADRATQIAGLAFDASVWELWPYLTAGASIHLPDETARSEPAALLRWLTDQAITLSFVPTPLCEAMLKEPCPHGMTLRAILTGGDKLHHPPPQGLPFELINHYGPTENTVVATFAPAVQGTEQDPQPHIGRPVSNCQVYLVDDHLQPVPIGVPGELLIGGQSLARGYHDRDEQTAQSFIANPFEDGTRLYKTGDLARYLPDGNIEFLGRIDHQVKVRGFRIELGEIEVVLGQHPEVAENVVLAAEHSSGNRLLAYVVPTNGAKPEADALRTFLKTKLPDYMVPSAFLCLDSFPLTSNGKIDRRALPSPSDMQPGLQQNYVAPENEAQQTIATIWKQLLSLERVGVQDNFFDLGGHSLLIVQLHRQLQAAFEKTLSVAEVFQYPTIAAMAQHMTAQASAQPPEVEDRSAKRRAAASRKKRMRERRKRTS